VIWNEKKRRRIYNGDKDNLPKRLGDYAFSLSVAGAIAMFAELVVKSEVSININTVYYGFAVVFGFFIIGVVFYKKGGL
jgi:hypothetical protein